MPKGGEDDHRSHTQLSSMVYGHQLRNIAGVVPGLRVRARLDSGASMADGFACPVTSSTPFTTPA